MNIGSIIKDRCWCTYFSLVILLATMSSLKYYNLNSTVFDLGVFLNNFYLISEGYWDRLFLSHIQPLNFVWSLFYKVLPSSTVPIFILIGQASLLALPIIGLYRVYGPIPTIAFVLYFPIYLCIDFSQNAHIFVKSEFLVRVSPILLVGRRELLAAAATATAAAAIFNIYIYIY